MCLDRVLKTRNIKHQIQKNKKGLKIGYKVFEKRRGGYFSPFFNKQQRLKERKWLRDEFGRVIFADDDREYRTGYHIFLYEENAKQYASNELEYRNRNRNLKVLKVYFDQILASGIQLVGASSRYLNCQSATIVVAKKMYIPKQR
jgi:hypothetical protein